MKIAIQARRIFQTTKSQSDLAVVNLLRSLQKTDLTNQYQIYAAPGEDRCLESSHNFEVVEFSSPFYPLWEQYHLPRQMRKFAPDVLHCTNGVAPLYNIDPSTKLIVTLEDISFLEDWRVSDLNLIRNLERVYLKTIVPPAVQKCSAVITGSRFESEKIQKRMSLCPGKIEVVNGGVGAEFSPTPLSRDVRVKYGLPRSYVLLFSGQNPEQNTEATLLAYEKYTTICRQQKSVPVPLVAIGLHCDQLKSLTRMATWLEIKNQTRAIQHADQKDMAQIYSAATLFLHTPLCDSSEIEPLQAMACGTPVIASGVNGGTNEILGSAAMLSNPCDTVDIANKIMHLTTDQPLRDQLIENGYAQIHKYRWQDAAQKIIQLYHRISPAASTDPK